MTLSKMTLSINDTEHYDTRHKRHSAHQRWRFSIVMLSVIALITVMFSVAMLNVVSLNNYTQHNDNQLYVIQYNDIHVYDTQPNNTQIF
jgi:hypothetical protein